MLNVTQNEFIRKLPKAELHVHLEGTLEPELLFELALRNGVKIPYSSVDALRKAYQFTNLQDFLDIYYAGANVLIREEDFYDLTFAYMQKIHDQGVVHTEVFFDPQTHTERGIPFSSVIRGIHQALVDAESRLRISSRLILSFLRHLDEASALQTLQQALDYKSWIVGVGLDSSEKGNAPSKFQRVFQQAREAGFWTVAHAGEEGPASYVWEAIHLLNVVRIDHGNRSLEDPELVAFLVEKQIPLTLCPLSNLKLKVVHDLKSHPLKTMMDQGLLVTINSDDPAYFGGYLYENYLAVADALYLNRSELVTLAKNSFKASLLEDAVKEAYISSIDKFCGQ